MFRLVVPLLLLLEALVAFVPAQGLSVCLGTLGGSDGAPDVVAACDCGHHEDASESSDAPDPGPQQPQDGDCDGCLDLEFDGTEAPRPELGTSATEAPVTATPDVLPASAHHRGPRPDRARAPGPRVLMERDSAPPCMARVLLERATIQLRR